MSIIPDASLPARVMVPTLRPLELFHLGVGDRTACGSPIHGWYPLTWETARANACDPCPVCFPPSGDDSNSGAGWPMNR